MYRNYYALLNEEEDKHVQKVLLCLSDIEDAMEYYGLTVNIGEKEYSLEDVQMIMEFLELASRNRMYILHEWEK